VDLWFSSLFLWFSLAFPLLFFLSNLLSER